MLRGDCPGEGGSIRGDCSIYEQRESDQGIGALVRRGGGRTTKRLNDSMDSGGGKDS